jgi:hypothetical protein
MERLVQGFDRDPTKYGGLIRKLLRADRQAFYSDAIGLLRTRDESPGVQFLISLLVADELLLRALAEPTLAREQALALAQMAAQAGVMVDVVLAEYLAECALSLGDGACPPDIQRLMDILSEVSDGPRVIPCLTRLARRTNPYLQSKAVLIIGRVNRNVKWVLDRLTEPDPRVRANAIEALWGIDTKEVRQLLRSAGRDANNRVVGNALMALYQLGDGWVVPQVLKMASHESRRFRATAAWIMGKSGDPRFTRKLARMLGEEHLGVRTRAFAAIGQIRAATAQARQAEKRRVAACFQPNRTNGWRELYVEVSSQDGNEPVQVLPTQLILNEDGHTIATYEFEERTIPESLAITFVFPRTCSPGQSPFQQGVLKALAWKRPSDACAIAPYLPGVSPQRHTSLAGEDITFAAVEASLPRGAPPPFTDDLETLTAAFDRFPSKIDCSPLWDTIWSSAQVEGGPARAKRHLVVYSHSEATQPEDYAQLASAVMASRTCVHAVSLVANPAIEGLCQAAQGTFQIVASEDAAALAVEQIGFSFLARYRVRYPSTVDARELRIIVTSPPGWGEVTIPVPPLPARRAGDDRR